MNMIVDLTKYREDRLKANKSMTRVAVSRMAVILGVHPETIRRYIRSGVIGEDAYLKDISGHIWIDPIKFVEYLPGVEEND
jgi:hypothetical protein